MAPAGVDHQRTKIGHPQPNKSPPTSRKFTGQLGLRVGEALLSYELLKAEHDVLEDRVHRPGPVKEKPDVSGCVAASL